MAYIPRTSVTNPSDMRYIDQVTESNKWWYKIDYSTDSGTVCLPNCTTYAIGRAAEIAGESVKQGWGATYPMLNRSGYGDAKTWWDDALWEKGQVPRIGAIAVWTDNDAGWGGHVAVVEETNGTLNGTWLSMSGYTKASSGTRSFTNPGYTASWYFKYMTMTEAMYWYTEYEAHSTGQFLGYLYNPYVDEISRETPKEMSTSLQTIGNISFIEWKNSYDKGDVYRYKVSVAMNPVVWGGTNNRFNLFTSQPNSNPGDGYELAAVINGNIWGNDGNTSYPSGFTKVWNESIGDKGVLQFLDEYYDNNKYENVLAIGSTKESGGSTLKAKLYQSMIYELQNYHSALNGDLNTDGTRYCDRGAWVSAIHSFIGYNERNNIAFIGFTKTALTGAETVSAVRNIFGKDSMVCVLDGGGSTQVMLNGNRVRESSDSGGVRLVENAICIYRKLMAEVPQPVERDEAKVQIKSNVSQVRIRTSPDLNGTVVGFVESAGLYYNVLSSIDDDRYTWYQIGENAWVADSGTWFEYLPTKVVEITSPVERNDRVDQLQVNSSVLNVRLGPGVEYALAGSESHYAQKDAYYNVLDVVEVE